MVLPGNCQLDSLRVSDHRNERNDILLTGNYDLRSVEWSTIYIYIVYIYSVYIYIVYIYIVYIYICTYIVYIYIYTIWLWLTSPWNFSMAHRNRWFTVLQNGRCSIATLVITRGYIYQWRTQRSKRSSMIINDHRSRAEFIRCISY